MSCTVLAEWFDGDGEVIQVDYQGWKIANWDTKLYGGHQFERLLAEFKAIANHLTVQDLTIDDIATSSGLSGLTPVSNRIWAVSTYCLCCLEL